MLHLMTNTRATVFLMRSLRVRCTHSVLIQRMKVLEGGEQNNTVVKFHFVKFM